MRARVSFLGEMMRHIYFASAIFAIVSGWAVSARAVPVCKEEDKTTLPAMERVIPDVKSDHEPIRYPFGSRKAYGFYVEFVVDAEGHVMCAGISREIRPDETAPAPLPEVTPQRQAEIDRIAQATFKPLLQDGKPLASVAERFVAEEQLPQYHVLPPLGELVTAHIHQDWHADLVPGTSSYALDIYGDGRVVYQPLYDDTIGRQTYTIPPSAVQALLDKAAEVDFWSYDDEAMHSPFMMIHSALLGVTIDYAGRSHSFGYSASLFGGAPDKVDDLQRAIQQTAHIDWWNSLPLEAIDHLQNTGFDFKGQAGSDLLSWALNNDVKADSVQRLLTLDAPVIWSVPAYNGLVRSPLTAALEAKQIDLARAMIESGALLRNGKPDQARINSAFIASLDGGLMQGVDLIRPYKPAMMAPDMAVGKKQVSVIFWLARGGVKPDAAALAEWLIGQGAPVSARDAEGQSILSFASETGQIEIVKVLLAHGASPDAIDDEDPPPLAETWDEDVTMVLLDAGADPAKLDGGYDVRFYSNVRYNHWAKVRSWLEAHGFGEALQQKE